MQNFRQYFSPVFYRRACWLWLPLVLHISIAEVAARNYSAQKVAPNSPQQVITGRANVSDGDTLVINRVHIRLFAIDAPEMDQFCAAPQNPHWRCGVAAREALINNIAQQNVTCQGQNIDNYKRLVAVCFVASAKGQNIDLNQFMVAQGWAVAYRRYSTRYISDEAHARAGNLGIWASRFMMPWKWRHSQNKPHNRGNR